MVYGLERQDALQRRYLQRHQRWPKNCSCREVILIIPFEKARKTQKATVAFLVLAGFLVFLL